jgi:hypothetical protein
MAESPAKVPSEYENILCPSCQRADTLVFEENIVRVSRVVEGRLRTDESLYANVEDTYLVATCQPRSVCGWRRSYDSFEEALDFLTSPDAPEVLRQEREEKEREHQEWLEKRRAREAKTKAKRDAKKAAQPQDA